MRPRRSYHQRVAIRLRTCDLGGSDSAAGSRLVLDIELLIELLRQGARQQPAKSVRASRGRIADNNLDRI